MSERSFRRQQARCIAREQRRSAVRRRRAGLVTGFAALGVTALGVPTAQAADFEVNSLDDGPADACDTTCTIRDAIEAADDRVGADTVMFKSGLSGTIDLNQEVLSTGSAEDLTIDGPGASALIVDGDGGQQVFAFNGSGKATVSGLTMRGHGGGFYGGVVVNNADLTIADSTRLPAAGSRRPARSRSPARK